jgi:hypothetical protein
MKTLWPVLLILSMACGKPGQEGERCRSADEMQMKCQIDYAENYQVLIIPDWIKTQCQTLHPSPGCYFDSSARYYW